MVSFCAFGYGPQTPIGSVHPDTTLHDVVEAADVSGWPSTNDVMRIVDSSFVGGTNAVNVAVTGTVVAATNGIAALRAQKLDGPTVAPTNDVSAAGKAADAQLTGVALTNRYTRAETDERLDGKANKNGDSIEDFAAKDINSIGTLTAAEILCGSTIHADGDINCLDSDGNLHHLVSKANRAEYGDADEIATLDADGNPTRSGIAKDKIMPSQGSLYMEEVDPDLQAYEFGIAGYYLFYMGVNFSVLSTGVGDTKWYYGDFHTFDDDREIAVKGDIAAAISATDPIFSNAVLSVGLNIDTNSVAVLNEIAATFGDFPITGTATTVGGLLAALAAAAAWLKKNKVQTLKLEDGSVETSADGGVAKLDDFFTNSNSLLTGTIAANSARLALDEDGEIIVTMNTED